MSDERSISPGSIKVNSIILSTGKAEIDITNFVLQCEIFESIMSPIITGTLMISDASSIDESMVLSGDEFLKIDIETPGLDDEDFKRKAVFFVYKIEGRENINLKNVIYTIDFMSPEGIIDNQTKISKTFIGKPSDIARKILSSSIGLETDKKVLIENTTSTISYTSNFWTPFQNIYYLTDKAINIKNNPNFVFFENRLGYVLASIDVLLSKPSTQHFTRDSHTRIEGSESVDIEYGKILDMSTPVLFDQIKRIEEGFYGGSVYNFSINNKKLNFMNTDANKYSQTTMNDKSPMNIMFSSKGNLYTQLLHSSKHRIDPSVKPIDLSLSRMSLLKRIEHFKTNIQVMGRLDYTVGDTVSLTIYSDKHTEKEDTNDEIINNVLSGTYLVTGIKHIFNRNSHKCSLEICKDSIINNV